MATSTEPTAPYPGQLCSCGRPARQAFQTEGFGSVGYCGVPGMRPLNPHVGCSLLLTEHDEDYCHQLSANREGDTSMRECSICGATCDVEVTVPAGARIECTDCEVARVGEEVVSDVT